MPMRAMRSISRGVKTEIWPSTQRRPLSGISRSTSSNRSSMPGESACKAHRADVIGREQQQNLLGLGARQDEIGVEPRPNGVRRRTRAHDVRWIASDADDETSHLEPIVAES